MFTIRFGPAISGATGDAVSILSSDHRLIEQSFVNYYQEPLESEWHRLARLATSRLKLHMEIEEEVFYPAFLRATARTEKHHDSMVEHEAAKKLIEDIQNSDPGDEYFESMMRILWKMVKAHMSEEEQPGGMFEEARQSTMDLFALGEQLSLKKEELAETD